MIAPRGMVFADNKRTGCAEDLVAGSQGSSGVAQGNLDIAGGALKCGGLTAAGVVFGPRTTLKTLFMTGTSMAIHGYEFYAR